VFGLVLSLAITALAVFEAQEGKTLSCEAEVATGAPATLADSAAVVAGGAVKHLVRPLATRFWFKLGVGVGVGGTGRNALFRDWPPRCSDCGSAMVGQDDPFDLESSFLFKIG